MKLEIKKNMYIRTKDGIIDKVLFDYNGHCADTKCECKHICCDKDYYDEKDIVSASFEVVDLIKANDYVNGHEVKMKQSGFNIIDIGEDENYVWLYEKNIKTIVTKEQFKQIEYKIKED